MRGRRALHRLIGEIDFGEGPRWRDDRLWYSDFHQHAVYSVGADGARRTEVADLDDRPSGLGWLPDGTMLVVGMTRHQVLRVVDGVPTLHADLAPLANGCCNDMVVDATGNAYVGTFGFDLDAGEPFARRDHPRATGRIGRGGSRRDALPQRRGHHPGRRPAHRG